jgi:hypothetical protein
LFAQLREAIFSVLTSAEATVFGAAPPDRFFDLIFVLHHRKATVLTLNYDTIVEVGVASLGLMGLSGNGHVSVNDLLQNMPPLPTTFGF